MDAGEFFYARGELTVDLLQQEIARFWADVAANPELQAEVADAGLKYEACDTAELAEQITVRPGSSGADPESVVLIISLAPTANRILKDVWASIILPRIRRRWGDDAIGDEQSDSKGGEQPGTKA